MTIPEVLKKPLVFGDKAQIAAIKVVEAQEAYEQLPICDVCEGDSSCHSCHRECDYCDGTGKDQDALTEWREKYPCGRCG